MTHQKNSQYRGRFAPSPSGPLHFGSLVAALGSYLDARQSGGEWAVRIEDLDPPRVKPGAADQILFSLEAFGFQWDGEVYHQSDRSEAYHSALDELERAGYCYPCGCSRKEINAAGQPGVDGIKYPGTCRVKAPSRQIPHAIRICTDDEEISFDDRICGKQSQHLSSDCGDFIIRRADGLFAYQLAVIVDDAFQDISHIVRGADLLTSTPRQIYLQHLLELSTPCYAHLPLVVDESGRKLSKQSQAMPIDPANPLPALLATLEFLNQPAPPERPHSLDEFWNWAISAWNIENILEDKTLHQPLKQ